MEENAQYIHPEVPEIIVPENENEDIANDIADKSSESSFISDSDDGGERIRDRSVV